MENLTDADQNAANAKNIDGPMRFYQLDPMMDPRWADLVHRHPLASVFHSVGWLKALQLTYGYEPVAYTTSPPTGDLENGFVFCEINSWLTGRRLVSLPFSDHCELLSDSSEDVNFVIRNLQTHLADHKWKYLEVRPIHENFRRPGSGIAFQPATKYFLHRLDLRPNLDIVFRGFDKDSVQRRIGRAERAGLTEKCGRSLDLLKEFYTLFLMTRRRHHLPPIPVDWFRNLIQCQDKALEIRIAYKDTTPIAAILTLQFRGVVYYKYGCSDARFNKFGAVPWLLWSAIVSGKSIGANEFDMGRTQEDNSGLLAFKNNWVPRPEPLVYWKFPTVPSLPWSDRQKLRIAKSIFSYMPDRLLTLTGRLVYRHIG
jgi:Acetyltransferase (GNAT) domain